MEKEHKITIMLCILIAYVISPSQLCYSSMYVSMEADYSHSYEVTLHILMIFCVIIRIIE